MVGGGGGAGGEGGAGGRGGARGGGETFGGDLCDKTVGRSVSQRGGEILLRRRCKQTGGARPPHGLITSLQFLSHVFILLTCALMLLGCLPSLSTGCSSKHTRTSTNQKPSGCKSQK